MNCETKELLRRGPLELELGLGGVNGVADHDMLSVEPLVRSEKCCSHDGALFNNAGPPRGGPRQEVDVAHAKSRRPSPNK